MKSCKTVRDRFIDECFTAYRMTVVFRNVFSTLAIISMMVTAIILTNGGVHDLHDKIKNTHLVMFFGITIFNVLAAAIFEKRSKNYFHAFIKRIDKRGGL